jgi:hypothetical protein
LVSLGSTNVLELLTTCRKFIGYKEFAKHVGSHDDYFVLRRFDRLHSRGLLVLQDRLSKIEEDLDILDNSLSDRGAKDVDNGTIRNDTPERKQLLEEMLLALERYGM